MKTMYIVTFAQHNDCSGNSYEFNHIFCDLNAALKYLMPLYDEVVSVYKDAAGYIDTRLTDDFLTTEKNHLIQGDGSFDYGDGFGEGSIFPIEVSDNNSDYNMEEILSKVRSNFTA
jgi:hypothetical protein